MTDDTQPEALRLAEILEGDYCPDWFYEQGVDEVAAELRRQHTRIAELESELEAIGAGGVSGPLMGRAAPPTAQAEGWRPISTAPRDGTEVLADTSGLGRVVVYWDDEESQWGTGLGYLDRGAPTHWMPLPPPPTSADGVEHG